MGNRTTRRCHILRSTYMSNTDITLKYYNENAEKFVAGTVDAKMTDLQEEFLSFVPEGGTILDLGCGSGRDSKVFLDKGYKVIAVDGSIKLCKIAEKLTGRSIICSTFQDYKPDEALDGIWASASLLHLNNEDLHKVVKRLSKNLNKNGCFYMSFKYGDDSLIRNERYFTDQTEETLGKVLCDIDDITLIKFKITSDVRPGRSNEKWLNAFYVKK